MYICIYKTCLSPKVKLSSLSDPTDPTSLSIHKYNVLYVHIKNSNNKPPVHCKTKKNAYFIHCM